MFEYVYVWIISNPTEIWNQKGRKEREESKKKKRDTELQCFQMSNTINMFAYTT